MLNKNCLFFSVSGVSDHFANDDYHALHITKNIIANLNSINNKQNIYSDNDDAPEPPLYPDEELYGIVGENLKKNYDVREVFNYLFNLRLILYEYNLFRLLQE